MQHDAKLPILMEDNKRAVCTFIVLSSSMEGTY
jgi:hypothetical protein